MNELINIERQNKTLREYVRVYFRLYVIAAVVALFAIGAWVYWANEAKVARFERDSLRHDCAVMRSVIVERTAPVTVIVTNLITRVGLDFGPVKGGAR